MEKILIEEIDRMKLLFGEGLLSGASNKTNVLLEQVGGYFKKMWNDFVSSGKKYGSEITQQKINKFISSDVTSFKSLVDFLNDIDNYTILKAIIGETNAQNIKFTQTIARKIDEKPKTTIPLIFSKDNTGSYYFQKIPQELRGQFFYLLQQKYPMDFKKGLDSMDANAKVDAERAITKGKSEINISDNLPATTPTVRVDGEGKVLDFNKDGKAIGKNGEIIPFDPNTGKPTIKIEPEIDEGGGVNWDFDINFDPTPEGTRKFIGNMEGRVWGENLRLREELIKSWWKQQLDSFMPRVVEFYETFVKRNDFQTQADRFNELLFQELNSVLKGGAITKTDIGSQVRASINDAFIRFYRTLDNDPVYNVFNFNGIWDKMMNEFDKTTVGLLYADKAKLKSYLEELKNKTENDLMFGGALSVGGRPNISDYQGRIKISETGKGVKYFNSIYDYYIKAVYKSFKFDSKFWTNFANFFATIFSPAWSVFLRGSFLNARSMRLFLATESKFFGIRLKPFSKQKYIALILRGVILNKILWPLAASTVTAFWEVLMKGVNVETGADVSKLRANQGLSYVFFDELGERLKSEFLLSDNDSPIKMITQIFPGYVDDVIAWYIEIGKADSEGEADEKTKQFLTKEQEFLCNEAKKLGLPCDDFDKLKEKIGQSATTIGTAEIERQKVALEEYTVLKSGIVGWVRQEDENLVPLVKKISEILKKNNKVIKTVQDAEAEQKNVNPYFVLDGKTYYIVNRHNDPPLVRSEYGEEGLVSFIKSHKTSIEKLQVENYQNILKKLIMENNGKKFGEDNFKHWKETFTFKSEDKGNPGQYKEVKIKMEDVMDRINHYRKKYDEDDSFVRAVVDTHPDVVKIMYTKGLADINESATPRGLALVLRVIKESRGEMEIFSVARPANGNWFLVKGDYTQSQLANMDLEKKEPKDKEEEKEVSGSEELKKKEQTAIELLKRNEKEGLYDLPTKVREKLREKMGKGWTTEPMPSFLNKIATKSEINTIFNDKIEIYKLESNDETFDAIADNSSQIFIKRGFCRSLYVAADNSKLTEKQEKVVDHILDKCDKKFLGKLGVRNF